jgi:hypothetical protein
MIRIAISEVLKKAGEFKNKKEKIEWLHKNDSIPLRTVIRLIYDKDITFLLPETPPPWKKNKLPDTDTMLYREARRLRIFVKGGGYDNLKQVKRESLFISLLEDINNEDADLLTQNMLSHTPVKGLTRQTVEEAFPDLFTLPINIA